MIGDRITAECRCGSGLDVPDNPLGLALVARWHADHEGHAGRAPEPATRRPRTP